MLPLVGSGDVRQLFGNGFSNAVAFTGANFGGVASQLRNSLSSEIRSPFPPGPDPTNVVLSDSEKYLTFLSETSGYALFPPARRPIFTSYVPY